MKRLCVILSIASLLLFQGPFAHALSPQTHENINEYVANNLINGFSMDIYLRTQLGCAGGVREEFDGKATSQWIREGARFEDVPAWYLPYLRSFNHFHDPLTDKGFSGLGLSWRSSIEWSLLPAGTQIPGGYYSWSDVRGYFYSALTAQSDAAREQSFAETFRGVGQLMHLVQDASVPAHTRNDAHVLYNYENYVSDPKKVDIASLGVIGPGSPLPLGVLIDANGYVNPSPDPGVTVSPGIGLSEYTQANFFSEDTINASAYPFPRITAASPVAQRDILAPDGTTYKRQYWLKDCCGETRGGQGYLLSAVDWLDYYRLKYPLLAGVLPKIPVLDDNVYNDYSSLLLPRAIGYSASLLQYFFRIELEVSDLTPKKDTDGNITEVALRVKNATQTGEALSGGRFWLNVRYKLPGSAENNYRLSDEVLSGDVPAGNDPKDDAFKFTFSFPDYIPKDAANLQYTLAYRGPTKTPTGQVTEPDAVAGRVYNPGRRVFVAANNSPKDMLLWGLARTKNSANLVPYISISHQNFYRGVMHGTFEVYAWDEQGNAVSDLDLRIVVNPAGKDTGTLAVPKTVNTGQDGHATIQVIPGNEVLGPGYLRATFRVESTDGKIQSNVAELYYTEPAAITATIDSIEACYRVGEGWSGDPYDCPGISGDWSSETKTWQESVVSPIQGKSVPPVFTDGAINTLYFFDTHDPKTKAVLQDGTVIPLSGLGIDERGFVEYVDNKNAVSDEYKVTITAEIKEALVLGTEAINLHSVEGVYLGANAPKTGFDYFAGGHFFGGTIILGTPLPSDGSKVTVYFRTNLETERIQYVQ